jgi:hypothetical protein
MIVDVKINQKMDWNKSQFKVIGPYPFDNFAYTTRTDLVGLNNSIYVGYACAFPDPIFQASEIEFIIKFSKCLEKLGLKLLVRTYPSLPVDSYYQLLNESRNIEIHDLKSSTIDRYGDGREIIRFSNVNDVSIFLERCRCFVSLSTSFTIEAALFNIPIYHFYLTKENRVNKFEKVLFDNVSIKDHILKYFNGHLKKCLSYDEIVHAILSASDTKEQNLFFLKELGF